ncbi:MAG: M67 family metallopeptidase [Thermoflexales bacterium]|nr:M67 family metallopeptidase [Thermoflexales bacterium]
MLEIRADLIDQMVEQARAGAPLETCGVLGGRESRALAVYPLGNALRSPLRYQADPQALLAAFLDIESRDWDIVGIYHSHPAGPDIPSVTDVAEAYYPDAVYVIISLAHKPPSVRAFRIAAGRVSETPLLVVA